jgi:hypothetical protein
MSLGASPLNGPGHYTRLRSQVTGTATNPRTRRPRMWSGLRWKVAESFDRLTEKQCFVLKLYWGLDGHGRHSFEKSRRSWASSGRPSKAYTTAAEPKETGGALSSWRIHRLRPGERNQGAGFQAPQPALSCKGNGCTP